MNTGGHNSEMFGSINIEELAEDMMKKIKKEIEEMQTVNIILAGKTGVGKSTLINAVFRGEIAETGIGSPLTSHIEKKVKQGVPVVLYDTKGLELDVKVQEETKKEIHDKILECLSLGIENYIHAIWYCINALSNRVEDTEIEWIKDLTKLSSGCNVPVIIVLTQSLNRENALELKRHIESNSIGAANIIPLLAQDYPITYENVIKSYGLHSLVKATADIIPDTVQRSFVNAQKVDMEAKVRQAKRWANGFMLSTFGVGFSPIPFSDAPFIIGLQVSMLAGITATFGVTIDKAVLTTIVSAIFGTGGATFVGRMVVANLIKFIPGVGTAVGGVISGSTAMMLTAALGRAYIPIVKAIANKEIAAEDLKNKEIIEKMKEKFLDELAEGSNTI